MATSTANTHNPLILLQGNSTLGEDPVKARDTGQRTITAAHFFCTLEDKEGVKTVPTCLEKSGGHLREKMTATKTKMQASERDTTTSQSSYRYDHAVP